MAAPAAIGDLETRRDRGRRRQRRQPRRRRRPGSPSADPRVAAEDRRRSRRRRVRFPSSPSASRPDGRCESLPRSASRGRRRRRRRSAVPGQPVGSGGGGNGFGGRGGGGGGMRSSGGGRPPQGGGGGQQRRNGPGASAVRSEPQTFQESPAHTMADLAGKHGLIVGVANKRSISWAIAQAAAAAGARLALTYPSERLEENVRELAATLDNPLVLPCDVADDQQIADARRDARSGVRRPRLPRARRRVRAGRRAEEPVHRDLARELPHRARRQRLFADRPDPRGDAADGEARRRQRPDADLHRQRSRVHELQRDGRGQGGARVVGPLSRVAISGPKNIRVNAISAGAIKTLASAGISGFSTMLQVYREKSPLRRGVETSEVADAAVFLLSQAGTRHHRRSPDGRLRLPRHGRRCSFNPTLRSR